MAACRVLIFLTLVLCNFNTTTTATNGTALPSLLSGSQPTGGPSTPTNTSVASNGTGPDSLNATVGVSVDSLAANISTSTLPVSSSTRGINATVGVSVDSLTANISTSTLPVSSSTRGINATVGVSVDSLAANISTSTSPVSSSTRGISATVGVSVDSLAANISTSTSPVSSSTRGINATVGVSVDSLAANISTSTSPVSSSTRGTTPSTSRPTSSLSPNTPSYTVDIDNLRVTLEFSIRFEVIFDPALRNESSEAFTKAKQNYSALLTPVYRDTAEFDRVEITKFWEGSLGVDYTVLYKASVNIAQLTETLQGTVKGNLTNLPEVDLDYVDSVFLRETTAAVDKLHFAENDPCRAFAPCTEFYKCSRGQAQNTPITCTSPCDSFNKCNEPNGQCELNRLGQPVCRCVSDKHYIYGGEDCSDKAEKMLLSSEYIIAIGAGVGGGVILILVIALVVVCCRRGRKGDNSDQKSVASFHSDFNDAAQGRDKSDTNSHLYNQPLERRYQHMKRQDSGLPSQDTYDGDVRSPAGRATGPATEGDRAAYGRDGRLYRVKDDIATYSPEEAPFFRNQAFESFPEPGPFNTSEIISSRGVQRPVNRQSRDSFNPLVHSGAHPYRIPGSRQPDDEPRTHYDYDSSGNQRYDSAWTGGNPESRDNRGIEDRSRYLNEGLGRSDRPSTEARGLLPRIPADAETGMGSKGQIYDYTAWGARRVK